MGTCRHLATPWTFRCMPPNRHARLPPVRYSVDPARQRWLLRNRSGPSHSPVLVSSIPLLSLGDRGILVCHSSDSASATFLPHTDTVEAAQLDTRADMRLDAHLSAPPVIPIPDEDDDLHDAPPDIEVPLCEAFKP